MSRNIVLIVLDTVRKDYFDLYAPRLRDRADTTITQCRAASSWSVPSHTSLLTGELPSDHGVHAEHFDATFSFDAVDRDRTVLADLEGYRSIGISANAYMNTAFGFDGLFDEFHDYSIGSHTAESLFPDGIAVQQLVGSTDASGATRYLSYVRSALAHERPAKSLANLGWSQVGRRYKRLPLPEVVDDGAKAISRTAARRTAGVDEPFVCFINYMDAHTPLRPLYQYDSTLHSVPNRWSSTRLNKWELNVDDLGDEDYARHYRALYGAAIDYLDRRVSRLIEAVQETTNGPTTFVVIADHGHELGYPADGGRFHHTGSLSEGVLHTPCVIVNPPAGYPERIDDPFSQLRIPALVRRLAADRPWDDALVSDPVTAELVGLLGVGDGTWDRTFSENAYAHWNRMIRCVYHDGRKIQWDSRGGVDIYELDHERPCWQRRLSDGTVPDWARAQFEVDIASYKARVAARTQDLAFDDAVADQLETLGYL